MACSLASRKTTGTLQKRGHPKPKAPRLELRTMFPLISRPTSFPETLCPKGLNDVLRSSMLCVLSAAVDTFSLFLLFFKCSHVSNSCSTVFCPIAGCGAHLDCLEDFEDHYVTRHTASCSVCSRVYPTSRLLSIHVSEAHDSYFQAKVARGFPMVIPSIQLPFILIVHLFTD